ncbi:hypothetical protein [Bacillus weihaiensis]|uniref:YtxH domain-containing protein n=1 Tax=Bacillus weihaiensis TaxID=1547283 RepID=A0A1L3MTC0_9BACI|nr:hypothetical protein [Bacillus weihaiensis]APH05591.1 hypothetical protein A9C19_12980 [Bacillus weihaiensis]
MRQEEATIGQRTQNDSKLVKGIVVGGVIGGCLTLLDKNTRKQVSESASSMKDSSVAVITNVKENPTEVKDQILDQAKHATDILKTTIQEAKDLLGKIQSEVVVDAKDLSQEAKTLAEEAREDLKNVQADLIETGSQLTETEEKNSVETQRYM